MDNTHSDTVSSMFPANLPPRPPTLTQRIANFIRSWLRTPAPQSFEMMNMTRDAGTSNGHNGGGNSLAQKAATVGGRLVLKIRDVRQRHPFFACVVACTLLAAVVVVVMFVPLSKTPDPTGKPF